MSDPVDRMSRIVQPAKVHGDSGVTAVAADVEGHGAENSESHDDAEVIVGNDAPAPHADEAGN